MKWVKEGCPVLRTCCGVRIAAKPAMRVRLLAERVDQDRTVDVPRDLFTQHILLDNGFSTFDRLSGKEALQVRDSLYIRRGTPPKP
jgi:hypothetical protein